MRVDAGLSKAFDASFERLIASFAVEQGLLPDEASLSSRRFVARSLVPHIQRLSSMFNRFEPGSTRAAAEKADRGRALDPYWKETGNRENLRLAYFLYFMPANLYRVASIWGELHRLGFRWGAKGTLRAIEFGAGPAAGASGVAAGERFTPLRMPREGDWALIEQDRATLELGRAWAERYFGEAAGEKLDWGTRPFHRKIDLGKGLLPRTAPRFNLWVMSFFLNELSESPAEIADALIDAWEKHLDEEGIVLLVEPALKPISRKLLQLRKVLLSPARVKRAPWLRVLLPCLGHQACGALAQTEDWCHEEVSWWRPPYYRKLDDLAGLDRKTLPFSYLVIARSRRETRELLPALAASRSLHRLVSPAHAEGRDQEFFLGGELGKLRARYRGEDLERGDVLEDAEIRGSDKSARVERISRRR
jgi:hypothetical protein